MNSEIKSLSAVRVTHGGVEMVSYQANLMAGTDTVASGIC